MAFNLENMTIDYRKMLRMVPTDRATLAQSGTINDLIGSLTPGQLANLFPKYYRDRLPDTGLSSVSGGGLLSGTLSGGTRISGGTGGNGTYSPAVAPPRPSKTAQELAVEQILRESNIEPKKPSNAQTLDKIIPGISNDADLVAAINEQASRFGVTPASIAMVVKVENPGLNPGISGGAGGRFSGLYQIGPTELGTLGLTPEQYRAMSAAEQTRVWGNWLESVNFRNRTNLESGNTNQNFTMLMANQLGSGRDLRNFDPNSQLASGQASYIGGNNVTFSSLNSFAESVNPGNAIDFEAATDNIQSLESLRSELIPLSEEIRNKLDPKTLELYDKGGPEVKWNIEHAIGSVGVDEFNKRVQSIAKSEGNVIATAQEIAKVGGDAVLDPTVSRVSQQQQQLAGTRKLPLQQDLIDTMNYAAQKITEETGRNIYLKTFSGGQAALGTAGPRTGSTEHDLGGAADNYFIEVMPDGTERRLSLRNPEDKAIMYKAAYHFARAGGRSVGLESGYMGDESIHLGISRNNPDLTHHADRELSAMVDQGRAEFLREAQEKGWDTRFGYRDFFLQEKQKREAAAEAAARQQSAQAVPSPVSEGMANAGQPEKPATAGVPSVAPSTVLANPIEQATTSAGGNTVVPQAPNVQTIPTLASGGTVPMTPGENIAGINTNTGQVEFMSNDRELYTKDDQGNLRVDPSTIKQEEHVQSAPADTQRLETANQPTQRKVQQPVPRDNPDPEFLETMSSGSMSSSPSQLRALNRAKLYSEQSSNLVNGHFA